MTPAPPLEWSAPAGCPDAGEVRAAVGAMLDSSSWSRAPAGMTARGVVTETDGGRYVLRVYIRSDGASETKTIDADTCATLADAYAVIVAFTIDPGARIREDRADAPRQVPVGPARAEPSVAPSRAAAVRGVVGPVVAAGVGFLPFPALGVGARVGIESTLWWQLAGMYWPERPSSVLAGSGTPIEAHVSLAAIEPSVCLPLAHGTFATCAGTQLGLMPATGTGMQRPGSGTSWWLAPTVAVAARVPVTRVFDLRLRLDVGVPLLRPSFVAQDVGPPGPVQVFRPAVVFGTLGVEAAISLFSTDPAEARHVGK